MRIKSTLYSLILVLCTLVVMGAHAGLLADSRASQLLPDSTVGRQYEEVTVEQSLQVLVDSAQVFDRLADLDNYAHFYPLFSDLTVSPHHQAEDGQGKLVDFTGMSIQRFGPFFVEHTYYGMLSVDTAKSRIQLHMVDGDGVFTRLNIHIIKKDGYTQIDLKTVIRAPQPDLVDVLVDELRAPTLRLEALKVLLENDILPASYFCQPSANSYRYCF